MHFFLFRLHAVPDLALLALNLFLLAKLTLWLWERPAWRSGRKLIAFISAVAVLAAVAILTYLLVFWRFQRLFHLSNFFETWVTALGFSQAALVGGVALGCWFWRHTPPYEPKRRNFFRTAGAMLGATPGIALGAGIITRNRFKLNEVNIALPNLPRELEGLRIVQITDIHLSAFLSAGEFARAIDMANETRAHVALVTGDLITRPGDPLDACLRQLARLKAEAGVLGCLGNHEIYTATEDYVTAQGRRLGMEFLRNQARLLRFGNASINFAGVDFQRRPFRYLAGAEKLIQPGVPNVLLSHNPDVFPVAARQGYDLTIAGHTHGGQINVEILHQNISPALWVTPYVRGIYRKGNASIFVSAGLGTIGVPARLGAPAEVSLIKLCAS